MNRRKSSSNVHSESTVESYGGRVVFTCTVSAVAVYDPHYGADADGNRGEPRTFIEDIEADEESINITAKVHGKSRAIEYRNLRESNRERICIALEEAADDWEGESCDCFPYED